MTTFVVDTTFNSTPRAFACRVAFSQSSLAFRETSPRVLSSHQESPLGTHALPSAPSTIPSGPLGSLRACRRGSRTVRAVGTMPGPAS